MSYSYYLMHGLTLKALALMVARFRPGFSATAAGHWAFMPIAFATTLFTSAVVFASIEKRFSLAPGVPRTVPIDLLTHARWLHRGARSDVRSSATATA